MGSDLPMRVQEEETHTLVQKVNYGNAVLDKEE